MNESFQWVRDCIKSCTNTFQLDSARILVQLFNLKYEGQRAMVGELEDAIIEMETFLSVDA